MVKKDEKSLEEEILNKTNQSIAIIGHVDHGKTSLSAAITKVISRLVEKSKSYSVDKIDSTKEERERGITVIASHILLVTWNSIITLIDCPGHADYFKNFLSGTSQIDAAILVVSALSGFEEQSIEHLRLICWMNVKQLIVVINKVDAIPKSQFEDDISIIEEDIRVNLIKFKFDPNKVPIFLISSLAALGKLPPEIQSENEKYGSEAIEKLVRKMEELPKPKFDYSSPFLMPISDVKSITGIGTVVTGRVKRGLIKPGDKIQVVGNGNKITSAKIRTIESHNQKQELAKAGDDVGISLLKEEGLKFEKSELAKGRLLIAPNSIKLCKKIIVNAYVLSTEDGGRPSAIKNNYQPVIFFGVIYSTCAIELKEGEIIELGKSSEFTIKLQKEQALEEGDSFFIREGGKLVAAGTIKSIIE